MKTFFKVLKIIGIVLLVLIAILSILVAHELDESGKRIAIYKAYSPPYCPNTKWVCQGEDIFFVSDSEGRTIGQVGTPEDDSPFTIGFSSRSEHFAVYRPLEGPGNYEYFIFNGDASYSEGVCTLTYQGEDDEEHFWGDKTGQVTLTFVREELPKED